MSEFFIDQNSGDPNEPLASGRYLVRVSTPHRQADDGCHTVGRFGIEYAAQDVHSTRSVGNRQRMSI